MDTKMQDDGLVKADLQDFERLKLERAPWEDTWTEIDNRFPDGAGGFNKASPGGVRGQANYDGTHITALERFAAAGVAITTPEERQYIRLRFLDDELMKLPAVQRWAERNSRRLYGIRHALHTGFSVAAFEDWDQLGRYGTSPMLVDAVPGWGLYYRTLHLSECYIDVNFAGQVDTIMRCFKRTVRHIEQEFGQDALTPKMAKALADNKPHEEFEILHVVAPNREWDADKLDWRRMPVASRYMAIDEKVYLRRAGYHTMPMATSRHMTSAGEKYGRSPAIKTLPTINGLQAMRKTTLRAGHKAVDPALAFYNEDGISGRSQRIQTKAGGLNPGLVDEMGHLLVQRVPGGENGLPYALEMIEQERQTVKTNFLEEFYKILTDPNSRMTTVEVMEVMRVQGMLVRPFAGRYATEKQHPVSQRELDLGLRAGQIEPFPAEVIEAGEWPLAEYENPLAAMARAESTGKTMRFGGYATQLATLEKLSPTIARRLNLDAMLRGGAEEIGVRPDYVHSPEETAALDAQEAEQKQMAAGVEQLQGAAGAYLDLAKGNQLAAAA